MKSDCICCYTARTYMVAYPLCNPVKHALVSFVRIELVAISYLLCASLVAYTNHGCNRHTSFSYIVDAHCFLIVMHVTLLWYLVNLYFSFK